MTSTEFTLSEERIDDTTSLIAVGGGGLDLFTTPQFKQAAMSAIDGGATRLIVDLGNADMLDSTALGTLVSTRKRLLEAGSSQRPMVIIATRPIITRTLEITGLESIFPIVGDRDQAIAELDG